MSSDGVTAEWSGLSEAQQLQNESEQLLSQLVQKNPIQKPTVSQDKYASIFNQYVSTIQSRNGSEHADDFRRKKRRRHSETASTDAEQEQEEEETPRESGATNVPIAVIGAVGAHTVALISENLSNSNDGYWSVLQVLIKTNSLSARLNPNLLPLAIKAQNTAILEKALVHIHDIPETQLVSILAYSLTQLLHNNKSKSSKSEQIAAPTDVLIDLVISSGRSDAFLIQALKTGLKSQSEEVDITVEKTESKKNRKKQAAASMNGASASVSEDELLTGLLHYLVNWVERYWRYSSSLLHSHNKRRQRIPTFGQVLDWIQVLLDSHFGYFLLSANNSKPATGTSANPDQSLSSSDEISVSSLLFRLGELINSNHLGLCENIQGFKGFLGNFARNDTAAILTPSHTITDYQVELLTL